MQDTIDDIEILKQLVKGNAEAFDVLYQKYYQSIYNNICKMVADSLAAEDILQEVFLALWENKQKVHVDRSVAGWLFVVSYNKSATYLKQKLKESFIIQPGSVETVYVPLLHEEKNDEGIFQMQVDLIDDAVSHLPSRKKEAFRLCRFEGKTYEEVAERMGISVQSVKDYLKQATVFIKDYIKNNAHYVNSNSLAGIIFLLRHIHFAK